MAISKNNQIKAVDFNQLIGVGVSANALLAPVSAQAVSAQAGILWGTGWGNRGWGQTQPTLHSKATDDLITHSEWANLVTIQNRAADRTGAAIIRYTPPTKDAPITAMSALQSNNVIIDGVRDQIPEADYQATAVLAQNVRATLWQTQIECECRIDWATADTARWWFNTGSQVILRLSHNTDATPQDTQWKTAFASMGDIRIGGYNTTANNQSTARGYWNLTTSYQTLINQTIGSGVYTGDLSILVESKVSTPSGIRGDNSPTLWIRVTLTGDHTGTGDLITGGYTRLQVLGRRSTRHFTPLGPAAITFPVPL